MRARLARLTNIFKASPDLCEELRLEGLRRLQTIEPRVIATPFGVLLTERREFCFRG